YAALARSHSTTNLALIYHFFAFFLTHPAPTEIYTLSLHDALPISPVSTLAAREHRSPSPTVSHRRRAPGSPRPLMYRRAGPRERAGPTGPPRDRSPPPHSSRRALRRRGRARIQRSPHPSG